MSKPWEEKTDDKNVADSIPTFVIFCEDKVSEVIYFKYFDTLLPQIKVNPIGGKKSGLENVKWAIHHCLEENIMDYVGGIPELITNDVHVWCVFDYDKNKNATDLRDNIDFDESINTAINRGIKVAWSNDSFELWVLLHFQDVAPQEEKNKERSTYYDILSEIFRNLESPNEQLQKALVHTTFSYKKDLKSSKNFSKIVLNEMMPSTALAIARAKELEVFHNASSVPNHQKAPCTLIHHLIEELYSVGGEEIPTL